MWGDLKDEQRERQMKISEIVEHLLNLQKVHGDLTVTKWEIDGGMSNLTKDSFILIANSDFENTRYVTGISIR